MTTVLIILLVLAAVAMAADTVRLVHHDGRGLTKPPTSHFEDPMFRSASAL